MFRHVLNLTRRGILRRTMTTGRMPEQIGQGGKEMSTLRQVTALGVISCALLGPGVLLMLMREKPSSDH